MSLRVLVVDDDDIVASSLKTIIEASEDIEVVGVLSDGQEAIDKYKELLPDVLLMDIRMKNVSGLDAAEVILEKHSDAKILFLTTFSDDEYIIKALKLGTKGYILKQDYDSIVSALRTVSGGQSVFGGEVVSRISTLGVSQGDNSVLNSSVNGIDISEREQNVIALVAEGYNNKEIADKLFLSEGTVRNYISTILDKLELRDRTQLAIFYYKNK